MDECIAEFCVAIYGHRRLGFTYRAMARAVQPYAYGVDGGGHPVLRAYQAAGESHTGVPA